MVVFGGIVPDNETDDVEQSAIESRAEFGQKAMTRKKVNSFFMLLNL